MGGNTEKKKSYTSCQTQLQFSSECDPNEQISDLNCLFTVVQFQARKQHEWRRHFLPDTQ